MRVKRVQTPTRHTAGSHFARRTRGWRLIPASTAAVLALGGVVTLAAHEATGTGGQLAEAQLTGSASQSPTPRPTRHASRVPSAQPPRRASRAPARLRTGVVDPAVKPYLAPKLLAAVPVGPGPVSKPVQMVLTSPGVTSALDKDGIPQVALEAYQHAASVLAINEPSCHLPWQLVAAIGRVESDDGRFGGAMLLSNGDTTKPIYGIPLDGRPGVALLRDTAGNIAQAEGPMQFLPSTWAEYGVDGNGDGKADIDNIFDSALAAGDFLCAGGGDMNNPAQEAAAVFRYNNADDYVHVVLALAASYENGDAVTVPMTAGPVGTPDSGGGSTPPALANGQLGPLPAPVTVPTGQPTVGGGQIPPALPPVAQPSSPCAGTPAPTRTGAQTSTPQCTPQFSPTTELIPMVNPTPTTTEGSSGGSTPPASATPAPTSTTETGLAQVDQPSQAPLPPSTQSSSSTTAASPIVHPTPTTTTAGPSGDSTTTPPSTATTESGSSASEQPGQAPASTPTPTFHPGQTVDVGWAPAMRQVVVKLLAASASAPTEPVQGTHPGSGGLGASTP